MTNTVKNLLIVISAISLIIATLLIYSLAGLRATPVTYVDPPSFVQEYVSNKGDFQHSPLMPELISSSPLPQDSALTKLEMELTDAEKLVLRVILDGETPVQLIQLFTHPEQSRRIEIASALASVNSQLTHDEASGFAEQRDLFWQNVGEQITDIENALFEALINSAKNGTANYIPYTIAWMPTQDHKTIEILAWTAEHHPDPWIRNFSLFFVVEYGHDDDLTGALLASRVHDPDYTVRKQVFDIRMRHFTSLFTASGPS